MQAIRSVISMHAGYINYIYTGRTHAHRVFALPTENRKTFLVLVVNTIWESQTDSPRLISLSILLSAFKLHLHTFVAIHHLLYPRSIHSFFTCNLLSIRISISSIHFAGFAVPNQIAL